MTVIITGGTGLLGRYLEKELKKQNINYKILSRNPHRNQILCDYSFKMLNEILKDGDILVHLAGSRNPGNSLEDFEQEQNIFRSILNITNLYNYKKVILASSISVYSEEELLPWSEENATQPKSYYGLNKLLLENEGRIFSNKYKLNLISLRFSHLYGFNEKNNYMINYFLRLAFNKKKLTVTGMSNKKRELLYAKDAALAIIKVMENNLKDETLNIKGAEILSNIEIAEKINKVFNNNKLEHVDKQIPDKFNSSFMDGHRALEWINYSPQYTFEEGLQEILLEMEGLNYVPEKY